MANKNSFYGDLILHKSIQLHLSSNTSDDKRVDKEEWDIRPEIIGKRGNGQSTRIIQMRRKINGQTLKKYNRSSRVRK